MPSTTVTTSRRTKWPLKFGGPPISSNEPKIWPMVGRAIVSIRANGGNVDIADRLLEESAARLRRYLEVMDSEELRGVFTMAFIHGHKYSGPIASKVETQELLVRIDAYLKKAR